ncbi:MAG: hypothetical protein ACJ74Y_13000, partial [Bryobacteraceae bacterium]
RERAHDPQAVRGAGEARGVLGHVLERRRLEGEDLDAVLRGLSQRLPVQARTEWRSRSRW